ncbi:MAG: OmpA family protein [Gallionellaceae bacterium]|nr:OmpA family protein [Gallionellaceae bacterium]
MKQTGISIALTAALFSMTAAQAGEFDGSWLGGKIGSNRSNVTTLDTKSATTYGLEGGHNWNMGNVLLGVDGFYDWNDKKTHNPGSVNYGSDAYGLDVKLGLPAGKWLPYAKLGYVHTDSRGLAAAIRDEDTHLGLGVEYKFAPQWSVAGEYTDYSASNAGQKLNNRNLAIGLNYYFGKPAPAVVAAAPAVVKEEPKAAPAPAPAPAPTPETWKTLLENKPVCIEGANFEFDSAKLRSQEIKKLDEVAAFAEKYKDAQLESSGHTCNIGTEAYNLKLSKRRAETVKAYLVKKGVAAQRIDTVGYGEAKPVADNKTREGRELNRRVEICTVIKVEKKVRVTE